MEDDSQLDNGKAKRTIVEQGTQFKGTLSSSCGVDVRGRIEGDLETPSLTVSPSGAVHGRARIGSVESQGELSGEFDADTVDLAGVVKDNTIIRARSLEVRLSQEKGTMQVIFGECELAIGEEPTEHVEESSEAHTRESDEQPTMLHAGQAGAEAEGAEDGASEAQAGGELDADASDEPGDGERKGGRGKRRKRGQRETSQASEGAEENGKGWSTPPTHSEVPPALD